MQWRASWGGGCWGCHLLLPTHPLFLPVLPSLSTSGWRSWSLVARRDLRWSSSSPALWSTSTTARAAEARAARFPGLAAPCTRWGGGGGAHLHRGVQRRLVGELDRRHVGGGRGGGP